MCASFPRSHDGEVAEGSGSVCRRPRSLGPPPKKTMSDMRQGVTPRSRPETLGPVPKQLMVQVVCQICGVSMPPDAARADGWLVERWRVDPAVWVVRCYRHISEWSLRVSAAGRTTEWREKMADGKRRATEPVPLYIVLAQPMSIHGASGLPDDSEVDYEGWE